MFVYVHVYIHVEAKRLVMIRCFLSLNCELTNSAFLTCQQIAGSFLSLPVQHWIAGVYLCLAFFYVEFEGHQTQALMIA